MSPGEWISLATAAAALAGPRIGYGVLKQEVKGLREQLALLATKESFAGLEGRMEAVEADVREVTKVGTAVEVLKAELNGFQRLYDRDTDELKTGVRRVEAKLENMSFAPTRAPRKPKLGTA
jgi:hypothetical protein